MKLPVAPSLSRQDFPEAPGWISKLIYPIQLFITTMYRALTNGLSLQDNVSCQIKEFSLVAGAADTDNTFNFPCSLDRKPVALLAICTNADNTYTAVYPQVSFNYVSGSIAINGIKGLTTGNKYLFTVVIL